MTQKDQSFQKLYRENQARAQEQEQQQELPSRASDGDSSGTITLTDPVSEPLFPNEPQQQELGEVRFAFETDGGDLGGMPDPNQSEEENPYDSSAQVDSLRFCELADTLTPRY